MPLVRITARDTRDAASVRAIGDAVHDALVATLNVPADDRFQVRTRVPADALEADPGFLGVERRDPVIVEVTLRAGRSVELKRAFYARAADLAVERAGMRREDLMIVLRENDAADWSFGNGIAQYAP